MNIAEVIPLIPSNIRTQICELLRNSFLYGSYHDAISKPDKMASNERIANEKWIGEDEKEIGLYPFEVVSHLLACIEETIEYSLRTTGFASYRPGEMRRESVCSVILRYDKIQPYISRSSYKTEKVLENHIEIWRQPSCRVWIQRILSNRFLRKWEFQIRSLYRSELASSP